MLVVSIDGEATVSVKLMPDWSILPFSTSSAVNIIPLLPVVLMSISFPDRFIMASVDNEAVVGITMPSFAVNEPSKIALPDTLIFLKISSFRMVFSLN